MPRRYLPLLAALALAAPAVAQDDANDATEKALKLAAQKVAPFIAKIETAGGRGMIGGGEGPGGRPGGPAVKRGVGPTSGVVVHKDGYVISSAFNFANKPTDIFVTVPGRERKVAKIIANDTSRMLTLLKVDLTDLPVPEAFPTKDVQVGQWTLAMGRTLEPETSKAPSVSVGIVSALGRIYGKCIQTDCKVSPVNYGGPLVAVDGRIMGVLIPASTSGEGETAGVEWYDSGIGFAIPMEAAFESAKRMMATGKDLHRGVIGFIPQNPNELYNLPCVIGTVAPESVALKIGLKPGDTITKIDGKSVANYSALQHTLGPKYEGDVIDLTVERDGKEMKFDKVALGGSNVTFAQPFLGILPMRDDNEPGVEVRFVYPKSPAEAVGLKAGDRITKAGGVIAGGPKGKGPLPLPKGGPPVPGGLTAITGGRAQLVQLITGLSPGAEIELEVKRKDGGKVETVKAKLAAIMEELPDRDKLPYPATKEKALAKPAAPMPKGDPAPKKEEPKKDDKKEEDDLPKGFLDKDPKDDTKPLASLTGRQYWMYVPDNYDKNRSYGVIVWLHPAKGGMSGKKMKETWETFCDQAHFIMIGPKSKNGENGWTPNETEDVVNAVNEAVKPYTIDRTRIIAHGMGQGGQLALYMGFNARELIRGVAVSGAVLGINAKDNLPTQPLSFFLIAGDKDPLLKDIQETRDKLKEKRFPVIYREIKEFGKEYIDQKTLDELVVWLDSLDRI